MKNEALLKSLKVDFEIEVNFKTTVFKENGTWQVKVQSLGSTFDIRKKLEEVEHEIIKSLRNNGLDPDRFTINCTTSRTKNGVHVRAYPVEKRIPITYPLMKLFKRFRGLK